MTIEEMKNIDIRTVDPETLVDVNTIELDAGCSLFCKKFTKKSENAQNGRLDI